MIIPHFGADPKWLPFRVAGGGPRLFTPATTRLPPGACRFPGTKMPLSVPGNRKNHLPGTPRLQNVPGNNRGMVSGGTNQSVLCYFG